ncbi:MAG: hypothetical protein WBA67_11065, partial [Jannaschia sp.]
WRRSRLLEAVAAGDLDKASVFNAIPGRSLSVSDFAFTDLATHKLDLEGEELPESFFVDLAQSLNDHVAAIAKTCHRTFPLVLACSTPGQAIGLAWTYQTK